MKELIFGQAKINESLNKKLAANNKTLESINVKLETLSSALKNQLSFNKMIETQLAKIAAVVPAVESEKIPGQPKSLVENVNMVSTRWGNSFRRGPRTNIAGRSTRHKMNAGGGLTEHGDPGVPMINCSIFDHFYNRSLCDLGASMNILPKVIFEQLQYPALSQTRMLMQLADSTIRHPEGIVKNMLI